MRTPTALLLVLLAAVGCGDGADLSAEPSARPTTSSPAASAASATPTAGQRCTHPSEGYTVTFPADWHVAAQPDIALCAFFHPEPLELEPATEADGVAVRLDMLTEPFEEARRMLSRDGTQSAREELVGGRRAARFEGETDGAGLLPPGLATTTWIVDLGSRTLLLTSDESGSDDYAAAVEVLDAMARSVAVA